MTDALCIPDCSSLPFLGPSDPGLDHRVFFSRRAIALPSFLTVGERGHSVLSRGSYIGHLVQSDQVLRELHWGPYKQSCAIRTGGGGKIFLSPFLTPPFLSGPEEASAPSLRPTPIWHRRRGRDLSLSSSSPSRALALARGGLRGEVF